MPYTHGQPKKRRGPHPVVSDMRKRVRNDSKAAGGGCAILIIAAVGVIATVASVIGYGIAQVL